jgi:hypothetical protein
MKILNLIILVSFALMISCKSENKPTTDVNTDSAYTIAKDKVNAAKDKVGDAMDAAGDKMSDAKEGVADAMNKESVMDKAEDMMEKSKAAMKDTKDAMTEVKSDMKEKASDMMDKASDKMPMKDAMEKGSDMKEKATDMMDKATDKVGSRVAAATNKLETARKPSVEKTFKEEVEKVDLKKSTKSNVPNKPGPIVDHTAFHKLLSTNVSSSGVVNYKAFVSNDKFEKYLAQLTGTDISSLSKSAQLAFWINAYNAFTIKKVSSNYPLGSITDLDGGKPWDAKWIKLNGKTLSLNDIENVIIRPQFKEPRIHFAVNCAAKSCPPILNAAYSAGNLNTNLEKSTKAFINNSKYNTISKDKVVISKIFDWYKEDFGDIISYLNKYADVKINDNATVEYNEYDWSLNDK